MSHTPMSRRKFMGAGAALLASLGLGGLPLSLGAHTAETPDTGEGPYSLPPLGFDFDALEPSIDAKTMRIHYTKHHAGYVRKLNAAVTSADFNAPENPADLIRNLLEVPQSIRTKVRQNGGGHVNHTLFWSILSPKGGGQPDGVLADAIKRDFGSFKEFKEAFSEEAKSVFGSGWAWLCAREGGKLFITHTPNQDNPIMDVVETRGQPIMGIDVWEHAYYLNYQNERGKYIDAFWDVVKWPTVTAYAQAAGVGKA